MKHYGDITKIHGDKVEPVTVICGGSPCQDLSVAGKRAGLAGERSGLFMEQVRIIREIRNNASSTDGDLRLSGRYAIWENVPGCLSSGSPKGEDFRIVLEEFVKVKYPDTIIPGPPKEGWHKSGCIVADGFSLAWRICAQYEQPITMGSLFDGIGGFPLAFSKAGATPVWASEIEEFCIAVTKLRFPEEEEDEADPV